MTEQRNSYDAVIIGGGPAGISAALYAVRGGLSVAVIHNGVSALHKTERIENYYGTGVVSGTELYERGIEQARSVGADIVNAQVIFAATDGERFTVSMPNGQITSSKLVIATGAARKTVKIPGLAEWEGKGVSYCAVCDSFFYRKKRVGVIGAGEYAEHEYDVLKNTAGEAILFTEGETPVFVADRTVTAKISEVYGKNGRLGGVRLTDGTETELDGLFVAVGILSGNALGRALGVFTDRSGAIVTDERGMTNVVGLYAAGDCTLGVKQIAKAVADGVTVGLSLIADIKGNKK